MTRKTQSPVAYSEKVRWAHLWRDACRTYRAVYYRDGCARCRYGQERCEKVIRAIEAGVLDPERDAEMAGSRQFMRSFKET
jgi:hypothetical protein